MPVVKGRPNQHHLALIIKLNPTPVIPLIVLDKRNMHILKRDRARRNESITVTDMVKLHISRPKGTVLNIPKVHSSLIVKEINQDTMDIYERNRTMREGKYVSNS